MSKPIPSRRAQMINDATQALSRQLTEEGKLIESGFVIMRATAIHPDASPEQVEDMRSAFFAGAQHLWGSIMSMLDPGPNETPGDLRRMAKIQAELDRFIAAFEAKHMKTRGSA